MSGLGSSIAHGYLVLADISGYTSFLSQTELDHAQEILSDLLETVLRRFEALLTIHKIEGDAVFAYAVDERIVRGETLLELVEATYSDFRDRTKSVRRHTSCTCRACQSIPMLDLKFIVHHGDFVAQQIGGTGELAGSDVNLAHRLLKNHVFETTGWRAYALFTERALDCMKVRPDNLQEGTEFYEHLGEIKTFAEDLHARYEEMVQSRRVFIPAEEADCAMEFRFTFPPPVVWEWFNEPAKRSLWMGVHIVPVLKVGGRTAPGSRNHCVHGKNEVMVEDVLDIRPFDYFTLAQQPRGNPFIVRMTHQFIATEQGGTRLLITFRTDAKGWPRWTGKLVSKLLVEMPMRSGWSLDHLDDWIRASQEPAGAPG